MTPIKEYNAIETMHGGIYFTYANIATIHRELDNKFISIEGSLVATNQIILVRPSTGKEYYKKFIEPSLHVSIRGKVNSWISTIDPTIEQINNKIQSFQEEENKYNEALKQITPEQREERLKQIQAEKDRIFGNK